MFVVVFGNKFLKSACKLEKKTRADLDTVLKLLNENPFDQQLHSKALHGQLAGFHSLRVGRDYRVIYKFLNSSKIFLVTIAHRSAVYR